MSFLKHLIGIAGPIIGGIFGGPIGAAIGGAIGGGINGGAKGAIKGGALGFLGGEVAQGFGGGGSGLFGSGGSGFAGGASEGFANPFDEVGPPNPFAGGGGGAAGAGGGAAAGFGGGGSGGIIGNFFSGSNPFSEAVQRLFQSGGQQGVAGGVGNILGSAAKFGMPLFQLAAGLQGEQQAKKLQQQAALPNPADITGIPGYQAGLEAVQRSMAAQGYQGSGNMMAALSKYGGDFYNQFVNQRIQSSQAQAGPVTGQMSSLALLSSGAQGLARAFGQ